MSLTFITTWLRKTLVWLGLIVLCIILVLIAPPLTFMLLGYRVNASSVEVADLAAKKKDVSLCGDIINYGLFFPPSGETRAHCVKTYAALIKDPSACELLMPSSYGLSCVGGASRSPICGVNPGFEVQWHEGNEIKRSSLKDCQKKNNRSVRGDECCIVTTVSAIRTFNDCSSLAKEIPVYDDCLQELSFKNHDPTTCEGITDAKLKVACTVRAKAMKQDPSICTGCTPLLEKLEDIK